MKWHGSEHYPDGLTFSPLGNGIPNNQKFGKMSKVHIPPPWFLCCVAVVRPVVQYCVTVVFSRLASVWLLWLPWLSGDCRDCYLTILLMFCRATLVWPSFDCCLVIVWWCLTIMCLPLVIWYSSRREGQRETRQGHLEARWWWLSRGATHSLLLSTLTR